ncbi:hypothetical protein [Avibacterium paragallinarum]|uniref:Uncharacterized protein n=1 Tax=Avibacterium paragallinarum TaxID=728 RepID=A0A380Z1W3_AVIPA|nr:hypothetical protein [Avibacterium paragallinarum]SUV40334.1 Uncharacterised protein [Avibacterium paragallinarum]
MKNKYLVRVYGMVEITVEAESIGRREKCDLKHLDLNKLLHQITEIDEVVGLKSYDNAKANELALKLI